MEKAPLPKIPFVDTSISYLAKNGELCFKIFTLSSMLSSPIILSLEKITDGGTNEYP